MEKSREHLKEYFELIKLLNSSNKIKDQKTEIYFFIQANEGTEKLYAAISESQKIYLCYKPALNIWRPGNVSGYFELEKFICRSLSVQIPGDTNLTNFIKSHLFKLS